MPKLSENQKQLIVKQYDNGATQTSLAELYGVSRRSIQIVLIDANRLPPDGMADQLKRKGYKLFTQDQQAILELCKQHNMSAETLNKLIHAPLLTIENMVKRFASLNQAQTLNFLQAARAHKERKVVDAKAS